MKETGAQFVASFLRKMSKCQDVWCDMIKEFWLRVDFKKQTRLRGLSGGVT
jgi:hypothetical protein